MTKINKATFLQELLQTFPEFKETHNREKDYHDIGVHLIFGDFRRFAEQANGNGDERLIARIRDFIVRCLVESEDEVNNAVFVSFFENMNEKTLGYFLNNLPNNFAEKVKNFLRVSDETPSYGANLKNNQ